MKTEGALLAGGGSGFTLHPLNLIHRNKVPNPVSMRVPGVLTMPLEPWRQGVQAGQMGWGECPYETYTRDAWAWSSGYVEGRANAKSTT